MKVSLHALRLMIVLSVLGILSFGTCPSFADNWHKGILHSHSLWSDGNTLPELAIDWYRGHGYQFMSLTDHSQLQLNEDFWKPVDPKLIEASDQYVQSGWLETKPGEEGKTLVRLKTFQQLKEKFDQDENFLLIPGHEQNTTVAGKTLHTNALNVSETIPFPNDFPTVADAMHAWQKATYENAAQNGNVGFWMLNHPDWPYYDISPADLIEASDIVFYENCNALSGPRKRNPLFPSIEKYWDIVTSFRLLEGQRPVYAVASDDAHNYLNPKTGAKPGRGWVVVRAEKLDANALFKAMKNGDFYSSTGVVLKDVRFDPQTRTLSVEVDPGKNVQYTIRFVGTKKGFSTATQAFECPAEDKIPARAGLYYSDDIGVTFKTVEGTSASYTMTPDDMYVRAIISSDVKREYPEINEPPTTTAWTQPVGWE